MTIKEALDILELPPFITKKEIKQRYRNLAKEFHPDISTETNKMHKINDAYKILIEYIENYKYSFDDTEISKQLPNLTHNNKFKM